MARDRLSGSACLIDRRFPLWRYGFASRRVVMVRFRYVTSRPVKVWHCSVLLWLSHAKRGEVIVWQSLVLFSQAMVRCGVVT